MKIIIKDDKEFDVDDKYFEMCKNGIDKAFNDLIIKSETITIKDVDLRFQRQGLERGMSEIDIVRIYVENNYGRLLQILSSIKQYSLVDNTLTLRLDWFEYGLNDVFVKYCGFSLLKQPSTLGEFAIHRIGNIVRSIQESGVFIEQKENNNEGWY